MRRYAPRRRSSHATRSSPGQAQAAATAGYELTRDGLACLPYSMATNVGDFKAGGSVSVRIRCVVELATLGLVVDGGRALTARETALTEAEQAARAGAAQFSGSALRLGLTGLQIERATAVAELYLSASGHPGTATVVGSSVVATVQTFRLPTPLLAFVGIDYLPVSASAAATAVAG